LNRKKIIYDLFQLENKTVVLTGSSGRLGSQYAHILSASGANVVLVNKEIKKNNKKNKKKKKINRSNMKRVILSLFIISLLSGCENVRQSVGVTAKPLSERWEEGMKVNYKIIFGKVRSKKVEEDDD